MKSLTLFTLLTTFPFLTRGQELPKAHDTTFVCTIIETQAEFPGGMKALAKFISKNLKIPSDAAEFTGTLFVGFVVNEDGSISDVKILKSLCLNCNNSALEVFKKMPKWKPGKINGKPAKTKMVFPVKFGTHK